MAKTTFSSLKLKVNDEVKKVTINEKEVEVKQYLPFAEKYQLILNVLELSEETGKFYNPVKRDMFLDLQLLAFYTNLSFTQSQQDDVSKTYDILVSTGGMGSILKAIPELERDLIVRYLDDLSYELIKTKENPIFAIKELWTGSQDTREKIMDLAKSDSAKEIIKNIINLEEIKRTLQEEGQ